MATNPLRGEAAPVTLPGTIPPMPAVARILSRYDRGKLAAFVTVAIDLLDVMDGDPDLEEDDPSGVADEDGINTLVGDGSFLGQRGPGCPISDPGGCEHDGGEPPARY